VTNEDWQKLLDRDPSDAALRLQYSDWLEEQGRAGAEAEVQRWLARNRKWPNRSPCDWEWWLDGKGETQPWSREGLTASVDLGHRRLPPRVFALLPPVSDRAYRTYATREEAEAALAAALALLALS
jgi:uncharacterized protein (TIGR02996 family)